MQLRSIRTNDVLFGVAGVLLAWEVMVLRRAVAAETISEAVLKLVKAKPVLLLVGGILVGHLVWPQIEKLANGKDLPA